jgi:hypothetical protein
MNPFSNRYLGIAVFFALVSFATPIYAETSDKNIASRTAKIDGVQLRYLTAVGQDFFELMASQAALRTIATCLLSLIVFLR